jgi:23S rRNA (cytidine1920-2'-O)/16S rRNA (cytidine1409-2'-O)-methyltransferase
MKDRADKLLFQHKIFESRKKAQVAIEKGLVYLRHGGRERRIEKVSEAVDWQEGDEWRVEKDVEFAYVSRAGAKLQGALEYFAINPQGKTCLDVGLSTGGFADCLLQNGARWVVGVDVGSEQLHPKMRTNEHLLAFDKINARETLPKEVLSRVEARTGAQRFDLMVFDVSFISVMKVLEPQRRLLSSGGEVLVLFKPQFEVGPEFIHKKGLVDGDEGLRVLGKTVKTIEMLSLQVIGTAEAALKGEDGNQEYFIYARAR